eukprot:scaffold4179_cov71-Skeletonema_dohrnii-CCMP3373.AAC.2
MPFSLLLMKHFRGMMKHSHLPRSSTWLSTPAVAFHAKKWVFARSRLDLSGCCCNRACERLLCGTPIHYVGSKREEGWQRAASSTKFPRWQQSTEKGNA